MANRLQHPPRAHDVGVLDNLYHRKRQKVEPMVCDNRENTYTQQQDTPKSFEGQHVVFSGMNANNNVGVKMELAPEAEAVQAQSPLPPFSEIRRHGTPYSPAAVQFSESLPVTTTNTSLDNTRSNYMQSSHTVNTGSDSKVKSEEIHNQKSEPQETFPAVQGNSCRVILSFMQN